MTAQRTTLGMGEIFDVAKFIWRDLPPDGRMALVIRGDQAKSVSLLETLVQNVECNLKILVNEETAKAWIRGGPDLTNDR
jgi:hypothetical protein